jgi:predicted AAA+ superfamily ATPase
MVEFFYRTEDIKPDEVLNYFVETKEDRSILKDLKAHNPVILIGGRGVGKSFLLRVAENELLLKFETKRILPIYVTFNKSSLIYTNNQNQFQHWMLARLCSSIIRTLKKVGLLSVMPPSLSILKQRLFLCFKLVA